MIKKDNKDMIDSYLARGGNIQVVKGTKQPIKRIVKIWDWKDVIKKIDARQLEDITLTLRLDKSISINEAFKKVLRTRP